MTLYMRVCIYCDIIYVSIYITLRLEAGSELATAGIGLAALSFSGSLQVGSYKVSMVRDLAEGGFGKVALVKDAMAGSEYGKEYALKLLLCQTKEQVRNGLDMCLCDCILSCNSNHLLIIHTNFNRQKMLKMKSGC
jgi:hypothetical protein